MECKLRYLTAVELATVEAKGRYADTVPFAWEKMFNWLDRREHHDDPGCGYGLAFHDSQLTPASECLYVAGVIMPRSWHPCDANIVTRRRFEGGAYAITRHRGAYSTIGEVVGSMKEKWLPDNNLAIDRARPVLALYLDNPRTVSTQALTADVGLPVKGPA